MHLAACMDTPCVGVFSCINRPRQWFPRGEANRIIMPQTDCAKNDIKGCVNEEQYCILNTKVETVAAEISVIMDQISVA
jgi:heptosyltransferase-3